MQVSQAVALMDAHAAPLQALRFEDGHDEVMAKVFAHATASLQQTREALKAGALDAAVAELAAARRLMLFADSTAQHIAHEAAARFLRLDTPLMVWADVASQSHISALAERGDVVLRLSLGAREPQWTALRDTLLQRHASVLTITISGSPLARAVPDHIALDVAQSNDPFMPDVSATASLLLLESPALAVALKRGKALGRTLQRAGL